MVESTNLRVKYIYSDVIGFTKNRTIETQVKIVSVLNDTIKQCLSNLFPNTNVIYIPVGDGVCICLLDPKEVYDDHLIIAEEIIDRISSAYNPTVKPADRFEVRIGINENIDSLITDINGNRNVCGFGINQAQRIMDFGDSNHILVGRSVHDSLVPREKYSKAFRRYIGKGKHDIDIELYQYIGGNVSALNREPPNIFRSPGDRILSEYAAYYISLLLQHHDFIDKNMETTYLKCYALAVQMAYLVEDLLGHSKETKFSPYKNHMPKTPKNTLQEQLDFFYGLPWNICLDLYDHKVSSLLRSYSSCFVSDSSFLYVTESGKMKLQDEWSIIYDKYNTPRKK